MKNLFNEEDLNQEELQKLNELIIKGAIKQSLKLQIAAISEAKYLADYFTQNLVNYKKLFLEGIIRPQNTLEKMIIEQINCYYDIILNSLKGNNFLTKLSLSLNSIGDNLTKIVELLKINSTLKSLDLSNNCITDIGADIIFKAIIVNSSLTSLNLSCNNIVFKNTEMILQVLVGNSSLKTLNLNFNNISANGALAIAEGLKINCSLTNLDLSQNKLKGGENKLLLEAAFERRTIKILNLCDCNVGEKDLDIILLYLKKYDDTPIINILEIGNIDNNNYYENNVQENDLFYRKFDLINNLAAKLSCPLIQLNHPIYYFTKGFENNFKQPTIKKELLISLALKDVILLISKEKAVNFNFHKNMSEKIINKTNYSALEYCYNKLSTTEKQNNSLESIIQYSLNHFPEAEIWCNNLNVGFESSIFNNLPLEIIGKIGIEFYRLNLEDYYFSLNEE